MPAGHGRRRVVRIGSARKVDSEEAMRMGDVAGRRMTAEIEGDFVVFLIGARFNSKLQFARISST